MSEKVSTKSKVSGIIDNVKYYWNDPPKGKYMPFKEIVAYAVGGIGSYFLIAMGAALLVNTTNMIVGGAIGVDAMDMYILYLIATLSNIPLTAIRANMIDNTRGKQGKYRPYLLSMGLPTAIIAVGYVWFPYEILDSIFPNPIFGKTGGYVATCAVVLIFNLLLQFFYNFFNDAYTNLIHVLSPNTQERTDVLAIKSVVYSLAPSIINIVLPLIAQFATNNNLYDIRVYRIAYPVFAILGMLLTILVFANTQEKIVQAKTHTIQISFIDSFKEVAKNKYFWIIALAGWVGFLEGAYGNILTWSYNYGHTCNGAQYALIQTLTGNAALWGMLLAPICCRKWGKKRVLLAVNFANVVCILAMIVNMKNIWWLFICVYFNWLVGAFEQITAPAIQADIRDYQQYRSGERIDGMFASVMTIGNIITLFTSAILPAVQKHYGVYEGNGYAKAYDILDVNNGNDLLYKLMFALIIMAAVGAFLNMVPYFFYDFNEKKQKSVIRVLQLRSLFEDYGNHALKNRQIVEAIDMVNNAKEMAVAQPKEVSKVMYKNASSKAERKALKKAYKEALAFNEEIEISQFVCEELNKFNTPFVQYQTKIYKSIYAAGLEGIKAISLVKVSEELEAARALPKNTEEEKKIRSFEIQIAKEKIQAKKAYDKYFGEQKPFVEPSMEALTALFDEEDAFDEKISELAKERDIAKKEKDEEKVRQYNEEIKACKENSKKTGAKAKALQDEFAKFNRAAKPLISARKFLVQEENFQHFDEIAALYDEAKAKAEQEEKEREEMLAKKRAEEEAELAARKAAKKAGKK